MVYHFNKLTLDTNQYRISSDSGEIAIEPQAFNILVYLIEHRDKVVSRDELLDTLWPGKVVSDSALGAALKAVRKAVGDSGSEQSVIKTLHGRGYQFVARVEQVSDGGEIATGNGESSQKTPALSDKPSIAVLAFKNLSDDPEQEYFSDGISEDIIVALTRFRELGVIARNSSFAFKEQTLDIAEIGRKLDVQFIIDGSVRKVGDRVRITAQLIDTDSGHHLWAERYDRKLDDVFEVQDAVVRAAVSAVAGNVRNWEWRRIERKTPADMRAHDLYLRAFHLCYSFKPEPYAEAKILSEKALEIEPDYAPALAVLGLVHFLRGSWRWVDEPDAALEKSLQCIQRSVNIEHGYYYNRWLLSEFHLYIHKNLDEARTHAELAYDLNPSASEIISWLGFVRCVEGKRDDGIALIEEALQFDPLTPEYPRQLLGAAYFLNKNYDAAIRELHGNNLNSIDPMMYLVAAYQGAGRESEAKEAAKKMLQIGLAEMVSPPDNWLEHFARFCGFVHDADMQRLKTYLCTAGVPDGPL